MFKAMFFVQVSDYPGGLGIIYGGFNRLHMFACEKKPELIKAIQETAAAHIGISIKQRKDPITHDQFLTHKMGKYRYGGHIEHPLCEHITSTLQSIRILSMFPAFSFAYSQRFLLFHLHTLNVSFFIVYAWRCTVAA